MAWRVADSIVRGEIDNRKRGLVRGAVWLLGRAEPVRVELKGSCWKDLAGCVLRFENPSPKPGDHTDLNAVQEGVVGDMTASRKVRVLDCSVEEAMRLSRAGKKPPEHRGNAIYLEWFSGANGRVVIESADFQFTISERAWTMTDEQEREQVARNHEAIRDWLDRLSEREDEDEAGDVEPEAEKPMDEFQWEKFLKESDARTDKYMKLSEKYEGHPEREKLIARDMGWNWLDEALEADERGALGDRAEREPEEEIPRLEPNPLTEGVDWVRDEDGGIKHPLQAKSFEVAMAMWHWCDDRDLLAENGDDDLHQMIFQAQTASARLAGALNSLAYDHQPDRGFLVAYLKRALTYLHKSIEYSEKVAAKKLVEAERLAAYLQSLFEIREGILALMKRYREQ